MSSFLDSTGLSRLVSKITDYFAKKDGTYPNMTVGNVSNVVPIAKLPTASSVTNGDTTHVPTGDAVAQAVAGKISVYDGQVASSSVGSSQWSKVADATAYNNSQAAGIWIVTYGTEFADGSNPRQDFAILSVNFRGDSSNKPFKICFNLTTFYSWDASTYAISIVTRGRTVELWVKNSGSYRAIQFAQILNDRGGNNVRWKYYATSFTSKPVEDPSNNIYVYDAVICNSRDASWINSGIFDAAQIPASLPNATVGTASIARNLPYSIIDKGSQTSKCWKKIATTDVKTGYGGSSLTLLLNYSGYGYSTSNSYALNSFLSLAINSGGTGVLRQGYLHVYHFVNVPTDAVLLRIGSTNQYELWIKANPNNTADVSMIVTKMSQYGNWTFNETTDRNAQLSDTEMTTYQQTNPVVFNGIRYLMSMTTI